MLLIPCPWCGARDEAEFSYGGDASATMPPVDGKATRHEWHAFVHLRANRCGRHHEYWHHTAGCERWLIVERDTGDHRVHGAVDAAPNATVTK